MHRSKRVCLFSGTGKDIIILRIDEGWRHQFSSPLDEVVNLIKCALLNTLVRTTALIFLSGNGFSKQENNEAIISPRILLFS